MLGRGRHLHRLWAMGYGLRAIGYLLWAIGYGLSAIGYLLLYTRHYLFENKVVIGFSSSTRRRVHKPRARLPGLHEWHKKSTKKSTKNQLVLGRYAECPGR